MKSLLFAVLWMNILVGPLAFETEPGHKCENKKDLDIPLVIHADKDGIRRCCVNIECRPGTEAHLCEVSKPDSTDCIICKPGTFQSDTTDSFHMIKCRPHTHCNRDAVVYLNGSATTDFQCRCNLGLGYYGAWPECHLGRSCEPGQQLRLNGNCEHCPPDSYKITNNSRPCSSCSRCDFLTQEIAHNCTAVSDTICRNKTFGNNPDGVNNEFKVDSQLWVIPVVLGTVVTVIVLSVIMLLRSNKCRTGGNTHSEASFSSESTTPSENSIESGPGIYQHYENGSKQAVSRENLYQHCPNNTVGTQRETEPLRHSSLCECDAVRSVPNSDFDNHRSSESEGLLNSPSADTSVMVASVNLMDERQNDTGREDSPPSVQFEVETDVSANLRTDSVPFRSRDTTVMKGKYNVKQGNVYNFKNCNDITIVHQK